MTDRIWTPESLGIPNRQNFLLWKDMEKAYAFVETFAPFSITGNLQGFMYELFRRRWNLACSDNYEPPPNSSTNYDSIDRSVLLSTVPVGLTLISVDKLSLKNYFIDTFKEFLAEQTPIEKQETTGKLFGYGTDGYGTYFPLHLFWPDMKDYWGIYISEKGVMCLAASLYLYFDIMHWLLSPDKENKLIGYLLQIAYQIILRHQLFHFKIEQWALIFELATGHPYYLPYLQDVYLPTIYDPKENNLEEALANLSILLSKKINKIEKEADISVASFLESDFLNQQGPSYHNYRLYNGVPNYFERYNHEERYRQVVNYLCNQIIRHELRPSEPLVPYYLYPPNNNFLRAENLCPIYLVRNIAYQNAIIA